MNSALDLKPCPFCGSSAIVDSKLDYLRVYCMECGAESQAFGFDADSDEEIAAAISKAGKAWNRRPPESGTGTPPRDLEDAFRAGFHAGYVNADDSYPGPDEDAAFSEYAQKQEGKDQGLTASPLIREILARVLDVAKEQAFADGVGASVANAVEMEIKAYLPPAVSPSEPSKPPAPLPVEPATAPRPDLEVPYIKGWPKVPGWYWLEGRYRPVRVFLSEEHGMAVDLSEDNPTEPLIEYSRSKRWAGPIPEPGAGIDKGDG